MSDEQLPSADLLVKAVLLYPEAVVRLQVRAKRTCWLFGLSSAYGSSRGAVAESAGAAAGPVLCVARSTESAGRSCVSWCGCTSLLFHNAWFTQQFLPTLLVQRVLAGKGVGADAAWAALLSRPLFAGASDGGSASLGHLIDIWVERQHLLWKVGAGLIG